MPKGLKLSPDGTVFYVADMMANGVYLIDGENLRTGCISAAIRACFMFRIVTKEAFL